MYSHFKGLGYNDQQSDIDFNVDLPTFLDCDETSGRNTFKYLKPIGENVCIVKYYNKIVSNFEAGDVQKKVGAHLAEYVLPF